MSAGKVDLFAAFEGPDEAFLALEGLLSAAHQIKADIDRMVADREGDNPLTDTGCIDCTLGTVPHNRDTGLCGYHKLSRALARVQP